MKIILAALLILSVIAGCAIQPQKVWYKDGVTNEQFRRDQMSCRQYGMQSAQTNGLAGNLFVEIWINDETTTCLQNLGYQLQQTNQSVQPTVQDNSVALSTMSCGADSDCPTGQSCRSRKGGGTTCR